MNPTAFQMNKKTSGKNGEAVFNPSALSEGRARYS